MQVFPPFTNKILPSSGGNQTLLLLIINYKCIIQKRSQQPLTIAVSLFIHSSAVTDFYFNLTSSQSGLWSIRVHSRWIHPRWDASPLQRTTHTLIHNDREFKIANRVTCMVLKWEVDLTGHSYKPKETVWKPTDNTTQDRTWVPWSWESAMLAQQCHK